jgi:hypothetical protein
MRLPTILRFTAGAALLLGAVNSYADYASEVLAQGPLAYWRFGENITTPSALVAANLGSLGAAGNGTYSDVFRPVDGAVAGDAAVAFSNPTLGTSYYGAMGVSNNPALNPNGPFTVEFWIKASNDTASLLSPVNSMSFTTGRIGYLFYQNAAVWQFRVGVSSSTTASVLDGGVVQPNQWQHVVGVFTPTTAPAGTMTLFVDGVQVATGTGNYEPNTNASFFVGSTASPNRTFDGAVDEVAFFNSALSASQVATHFAARSTNAAGYATQILADAPVGYWRLNEPAALPQATNAGTLGAVENGRYLGVTSSAGPSGSSYPGMGANNSAASFSGTNTSYVQADSFGFSGPLTILAWVKPTLLSGDQAIAGEYASYALKLYETEIRFTTPGILDHTSAGANIQPGEWQQVGITFNPGTVGGMAFYVNGQQVGEPIDASALAKGAMAFWIGNNQWAGQSFNGEMDEVAVYDKLLTSGRIMSLYMTAIGSDAAPVMVSDPPVVGPTETIYSTTPFTITPNVAGALPMSYQWRLNGVNLAGATTEVYSKAAAVMADAGNYDVVVTNAYGAVTSQVVSVTINPAEPPTIDQQPLSRFVYPGGTASFAVTLSAGTQPLTYQWKHAGTNLPGATNVTLVVTNCAAAQAGAYSVGITNVAGGRISSTATLTLKTPVAGTYEQGVVAAGPVAYWRMGETSGTTAFDYAGGRDGMITNNVTIGTAGPAAPTFPGFESNNTGYTFDGSDAYVQGSSMGLAGPLSVAAWVRLNALSGDQAIAGENASWAFKVYNNELRFTTPGILDHNSSGAALTTEEWHHVAVTFDPNATAGAKFYVDGRLVSSTTASALTKGNSTFWIGKNQWSGQIFNGVMDEVAVYDKLLSEDTIAAMYSLASYGTTTAPFITGQPAAQEVVAGNTATLSVRAAGSLPLNYQWLKAGTPIAGATTSALTVTSASYADAGAYSVRVTNAVGTTNSAAATLTVLPAPTYAYLTNDLVLHLRFDGSYSDSSGRANDAFSAGATEPSFLAGKIGQGVHIATTKGDKYLQVMDNAGDFAFDETVSFSVGFWIKYAVGFNDVPIIGNAVNSTWQLGWVFTDSATPGQLEWSLASTANTGTYLRDPVGPAVIGDGTWHHVLGVIDRQTMMALAYVDGELAGSWSIDGLGGLYYDYPITIGQDPIGQYGAATFDLDDVGIWRRALTSYEALSIYNAGEGAGQSFDTYGPVRLTITTAGSQAILAWQAGTLESNDDLSNAAGWTAVTGAAAPTYTITPGTGKKFYRVRL